MKKAIILSGRQSSGKTHTANGIANFFDPEKVAFIHSSHFIALMSYKLTNPHSDFRLVNPQLVIVDECKDMEQIMSFESIMDDKPNSNFIFNTTSIVLPHDVDNNRYHLIQCNWQPFLSRDIKPVILEEYSDIAIQDEAYQGLKDALARDGISKRMTSLKPDISIISPKESNEEKK